MNLSATSQPTNSLPSTVASSADAKKLAELDSAVPQVWKTPAPKVSGKKIRPIKGFVELLGRSNFSFLRGASHPEEMVEQSIKYNYDGLGLCDLDGLYGVARGLQASASPSHFVASPEAKEGFHYIIGTELTLTDETFLTLVPLNKTGYSQLCNILTLGKRNVSKGFSKITLKDISENCGDLMVYAIPPISDERYEALFEVFGDRLYIPVWKDLTWESQEFYRQALHLEQKYQAQVFATQRPFMHQSDRKPLFDLLTCILHKTNLEEAKTKLIQNGERSLKSIPEICELWIERLDLVEKTVDIAARVKFSLNQIRYRYPQSDLPPGMTPSELLAKLTWEGAARRIHEGVSDKVKKMIQHELGLIKELSYEDYFLTLKEICDFAVRKNILYQGRGSAANSVVCFCIGLTSVNPSQIDLLFERFISRERQEPPDIDIDFEHQRREEVIQYIYDKYDPQHAAMVCTVIRYRTRMALREAAKAFKIPLAKVNLIIRYMGRDGFKALIASPEVGKKWDIDPNTWGLLLSFTQQLHGFPRHLGIHTGGFLITHDPIIEMVPVEKATMNGRYVIQWNKDDINTLKLMKIDVLSLGMLSAIRRCFDLLKKHKNIDYDLATIPQDDRKTYNMITAAETVGVFQIESRAQMNTLPRMRPQNFYDLVVEVALVRPGPLQGGMVHPYIRRRQGLEKVSYAHPDLIPILEKTHGIPIFQEQVMKIVIAAAGFTPGEADELRRIMSAAWRKQGTMDGIRLKIMDGFNKHGIAEAYAAQIYQTIEGFANYGFPESHAASFAILTYASCYLKCHHPDVFLTGILNSQPMGFYAPRTLIAEAQRSGVAVHPLSINHSDYDYSMEGIMNVRVGLRSVYGIPSEALKTIEKERKQNGPYKDLTEFIRRAQMPRAILHKLAAAGAFHEFQSNARHLLWELESISLDPNSFLWGHNKDSVGEIQNLFASDEKHSVLDSVADAEDSDDIHIPFESEWEGLKREYKSMGFSVENHPIGLLRNYLQAKNEHLRSQRFVPYCTSDDLRRMKNKAKVRLAGLVGIAQKPPTAKGMCFITLEDEFGFMNIVVHPDVYLKDRTNIYGGPSLLEVQGEIEKVGTILNIRAQRVLPLG